jgi:hypothetical protein
LRRRWAHKRVRRSFQRIAPCAYIDPKKTKKIQGKPNKKAWIFLDSFGGIGTFQMVTWNPNKKVLGHIRLHEIVFKRISPFHVELSDPHLIRPLGKG